MSVNGCGWLLDGLLRDWADKRLYIVELFRRDLGGFLLLLLFNTLLYSPSLLFIDGFLLLLLFNIFFDDVNYFPCDESSDRNSDGGVDYLECVKRHVYLLFNN